LKTLISQGLFAILLILSLNSSQTRADESDVTKSAMPPKTVTTSKQCIETLTYLLGNSVPGSIDIDLARYINIQGREHWTSHEKTVKWRPSAWLRGFKRTLMRKFRNINKKKKLPVLFIDDDQQTMGTILKYREILEKNLSREEINQNPEYVDYKTAMDNVESWVESYKNYGNTVNELLREHLSYDFWIERLKDQKFSSKTKIELVVDNKKFIEVKIHNNKDDYDLYIAELKARRNKITSGFFRKGSLEEAEIKQALHSRRLNFLFEDLRDAIATNDANGVETVPGIRTFLENTIVPLRKDRSLDPPSRKAVQIENKMLLRELRAIPSTINQSFLAKKGTSLYKTLTPKDIEDLGLNENNSLAKLINYIQVSKTRVIVASILSAGGVTAGATQLVITLKQWWRTDVENRYECAIMPKDKAFRDCVEKYIENKFLVNDISPGFRKDGQFYKI
jgi:hypothetical protein